jgi:hypothetical protein
MTKDVKSNVTGAETSPGGGGEIRRRAERLKELAKQLSECVAPRIKG